MGLPVPLQQRFFFSLFGYAAGFPSSPRIASAAAHNRYLTIKFMGRIT